MDGSFPEDMEGEEEFELAGNGEGKAQCEMG